MWRMMQTRYVVCNSDWIFISCNTVYYNIHNYIIGKLQWHSNRCEMTDDMRKIIDKRLAICCCGNDLLLTSHSPKIHKMIFKDVLWTPGMVSHKVGMTYWNLHTKLSNKTYDFWMFCNVSSQNLVWNKLCQIDHCDIPSLLMFC